MTEHWVEHPYRSEIALIGDAAGPANLACGKPSSERRWAQFFAFTPPKSVDNAQRTHSIQP
jgi:hypothetical protein